MVSTNLYNNFYEFSPFERLAEIKTYKNIILVFQENRKKSQKIMELLSLEKIKRELRGYHYLGGNSLEYPIKSFYSIGEKPFLLETFKWFDKNNIEAYQNSSVLFDLSDRFLYGFPIDINEFRKNSENAITIHNKNFTNKI